MNNKIFNSIEIGDEAEILHKITSKDVDMFVKLTGDNNPLHLDKSFANKTSFKKPVVHGMLTASFISTIIGTKLPGPGALWYEQHLRFLSPVRIGTKIRVWAKVIHKSLAQKIIVLETIVFDENGKSLVEGEAKIRIIDHEVSNMKNDELNTEKENRLMRKKGNVKDVSLHNKIDKGTIIVSGASRGIGAAIARDLSRKGYSVVINYLHSQNDAKALVKEIKNNGGEAITFKADISNSNEVKKMVDKTLDSFDNIYGIVNNASGPILMKDFVDFEWIDIQKQIDIQLKGSFNLTKFVLPYFIEQEFGIIVNIGSIVADNIPPAKWLPYNIVKTALIASTKTLANEYGPKGIRANCVSPGMTETDLIGDIPEKAKLIAKVQTPLRRLATPGDIAKTVSFLFSTDSSFITGQNIRVCGGSIM